jgi:hypothetical protein
MLGFFPKEWSPIRDFTLSAFGLECKYLTRAEMTDSKRSTLSECGINYALKTFVVQTHRNLIYIECSLDLVHILAPKTGAL